MSERVIPQPAFPGDDGSPDPRLVEALARYDADPAHEPEVLAALAASRVLVPVTAVLAEEPETGPDGLRREKRTDMGVAILEGRDGRRALPLFSGLAAMARWDPSARPVPTPVRHAALSAAAEGAALLVLDVAGPTTYVVPARALRRLAEGDAMVPAYDDEDVRADVANLLGEVPGVTSGWLVPAAGVDARLVVTVAAAADRRAVARSVAERMGGSIPLRARALRGFDLAVVGTADAPDGAPVFAAPLS